jgi:hypothetical protein
MFSSAGNNAIALVLKMSIGLTFTNFIGRQTRIALNQSYSSEFNTVQSHKIHDSARWHCE